MTNMEFLKDVGTSAQKVSKIYNVWKNEFYSYGSLQERDIASGYIEFLPSKKVYVSDGKNKTTFNVSDKRIEGDNIIFSIKEFFVNTGSIIIPMNDDITNTQIGIERSFMKGKMVVLYINE